MFFITVQVPSPSAMMLLLPARDCRAPSAKVVTVVDALVVPEEVADEVPDVVAELDCELVAELDAEVVAVEVTVVVSDWL